MLKASDLVGKPVVSEGVRTGYQTVRPLVDGSRVAVSYVEVDRGNESTPGLRWFSFDSLDQVEADLIRVSAKNGAELFLQDQEGLPSFASQVDLIGMKVISRMGDLLGEVDDYLFSRRSGLLLVILIRAGEDQLMIQWDDQFSIVGDIIISDLNKQLEPGEYERLIGAPEEEPLVRKEIDPAPLEVAGPPQTGRDRLEKQADRPEKGRKNKKTKKAKKKEKSKKAPRPDQNKRPAKTCGLDQADRIEEGEIEKEASISPIIPSPSLEKERVERFFVERKDEAETGSSGPDGDTLLLSGSGRNLLKRYTDE